MNTIKLLSILLIFGICISCTNDEPTNVTLSLKSAEIIESNNEFGYGIFNQILSEEADDLNILVSPLSISQALSMALNGAKDQTFAEMQSVLGFEGFSLEETNKSNQEIVSSLLNHDPLVELNIANSIWYRNDFNAKQAFIENNSRYYLAETSKFDPANPVDAKNAMNKWVDKNTKGKIEKIIDNVNPDDVMFLINAVYFKADWKTQFKKSNTTTKSFTLDNGTSKEVETMIGEVQLSYYNDEKFSVIKLPYGSGKFNLLIYLPEEGYTTNDIAPLLESTNFKLLRENPLSKRDIWLPKFEFRYEKPLNNALMQMGMKEAFDKYNANFSNISDLEIYISKVMHKAYIKTDEEGSEAAAVTSVTFGVTSVGPSEVIKINRSFLFAIVEEDTESILFMGKVFDPSAK
ncbi:MAG TPA: serpin family protein [Prolixibacteraceae bacterium]|nr:serpin family protein [Prolixibacteraceae bacterium]